MSGRSTPVSLAMASEDDSKVFIGIDCGTTYSGFCFAMGRDCKDYHVQPQAGDGQKIPTALLLKKDGSFKCAFGQPAIDDYSTLEEEEKKELLFYDRFKMALFFVKVWLANQAMLLVAKSYHPNSK